MLMKQHKFRMIKWMAFTFSRMKNLQKQVKLKAIFIVDFDINEVLMINWESRGKDGYQN